ncbi:MAG: alpha/beta hydrolase [Reyranella sp.]|nr:alpha/beta hydrolase [Reyranella sp.]
MTQADELDPRRFKTHFAEVGEGVRLAYVREGVGGLPLLLVHGWPSSKRLWWRNIRPLADAGFEVIVPDQRGIGESPVPADPLRYVNMAQSAMDLRNLLEALGHRQAVLAGGDFGSGVVQDLSNRFPGLALRQCAFNGPSATVQELCAQHGITGNQIKEVMEVSDHLVTNGLHADELAARLTSDAQRRDYIAGYYLNTAHRKPGIPGQLAGPGAFTAETAAFMAEPYADAAHFRASLGWYEAMMQPARNAPKPLLGQVGKTRTLILYGNQDQIVGPKFVDRMRLAYPDHAGPKVLDAGHFLQWERAELLNAELIEFCRDLL